MAASMVKAGTPFDSDDGDIILRSSDSILFSLHKVILRLSSPVFSDMFALGGTKGTDDEKSERGVPIVPVSETGKTLDMFLRMLYPVSNPSVADLSEIADLLEAGRKYQTEAVTTPMTAALRTHLDANPLRVFAIACQLDMEEDARLAAQHAVQVEADKRPAFSYVREMNSISAATYFRLLHFMRRGAVEMTEDFWSNFRFIQRHPNDHVSRDSSRLELIPVERLHTHWLSSTSTLHVAHDIIVQSSGDIQFPAHKLVLSMASPTLAKLIRATREDSEPAVIYSNANSEDTYYLLSACYGTPLLDGCRGEQELIAVAQRAQLAQTYDITNEVTRMRHLFGHLLKMHPLRGFFLAVALRWSEEAVIAARLAAADSNLSTDHMYFQEMEGLNALAYYNLLKYIEAVKSAREAVVRQYQTRTLKDDYYPLSNSSKRARKTFKGVKQDVDKIHVTIAVREIEEYKGGPPTSNNLLRESWLMGEALNDATAKVQLDMAQVIVGENIG